MVWCNWCSVTERSCNCSCGGGGGGGRSSSISNISSSSSSSSTRTGVELIGDCVLIVGACTMHAGLQGRHFFILLSYIGSNHVVVSLAI